MIEAFAHEVSAQRRKAIDARFADRLLAYARDLVSSGG